MRLSRVLFVLLALSPAAARAASPDAPEIWMAALDPLSRAARVLPANDYMDLFRADAPWPTVAAHLTEFELSRRFVLSAPPADLKAVVAELGRRNIRIAMRMAALVPTKTCGGGMQGYGPAQDAARAAARLRDAGGTLDAVVMDAPVWFGHFIVGHPEHPGCQMPLGDAAKQALAKLAAVRAVFPRVRVGEIEPFGGPVPPHDMKQALVEWFATLTLATGHPIAFLQAHVAWQHPGWQETALSISGFVRNQGMAFGLVYDGGHIDTSDAAWSDSTRRLYREIEHGLDITPDMAAFESATPRPQRLLPETDADTLTGVVLGYLRYRGIVK